jgi:hypothetical protein
MGKNSIVYGILLIIVAGVVGIELAGVLITTPPPATPITISCTLPGITCGNFKIDSANLTLPSSSDSNGTLSITLTNTSTGSDANSTALTYFINSVELGQSQGIATNQTATYVLQVPPLYGIVSGGIYTITAETTIGGATLTQNITTIAR